MVEGTLVARKAVPVGLAIIQSVHIALRCALVSTTDRWDTRLGGLEDRNKSAQAQPGYRKLIPGRSDGEVHQVSRVN
jgi:hypothetical protein